MGTKAKKRTNAEVQTTFNIQVCSKDGRLLSEYTLTQQDHDVRTIDAAERCACENLSNYHNGDNDNDRLVVVVSEETLTKLRQVQTDCRAE
ncbi:MAG: hypothetical protein DRR11_02705 [Gammaproteobacteria bacterium]|nr:MAG: hypothetical protein DRR11_02705 [Gammaproteobacteria bacterium]RLA37427.1 MAG: hypothetical protein DRR15_01970 [Gammaproteobacteria bacterium]